MGIVSNRNIDNETLLLLATSENDELFRLSLGLMQKLELFEATPEISI